MFLSLLLSTVIISSFSSFSTRINGVGEGAAQNHSYDYEDRIISTRYSDNLNEYFSNLTTNLGDNPSVNCVSVACGMIASYYDTYYNDNIIPEEYDVPSECLNSNFYAYSTFSSPGIYSELPSNVLDSSYNIQWQIYNNYLANAYDFVYEVIGASIRNNQFEPTWHFNTAAAMAAWLNIRLSSAEPDNFEFNISYFVDDFDTCKEAIDSGFPIFLLVSGAGSLDHAVVAFAYNEDGLIYHNGYKSVNSYGLSMTGFVNSDSIRAFIISPSETSQHVCSNNYYELNPDGSKTYYCPCMLNGMSYSNHNHDVNHTHSYDFNEDDELIQTATHYESCPSCLSLNQNLTINDDYSYASSKVLECDIDGFVQNNDNTHTITFICNNTMTESHHVIDFECVGTDVHEGYCICGSLGYESHDWCLPVMIESNIEYICICGLIHLDHDETWRNSIRNYLRNHDYFDDDFFIELIDELLSLE